MANKSNNAEPDLREHERQADARDASSSEDPKELLVKFSKLNVYAAEFVPSSSYTLAKTVEEKSTVNQAQKTVEDESTVNQESKTVEEKSTVDQAPKTVEEKLIVDQALTTVEEKSPVSQASKTVEEESTVNQDGDPPVTNDQIGGSRDGCFGVQYPKTYASTLGKAIQSTQQKIPQQQATNPQGPQKSQQQSGRGNKPQIPHQSRSPRPRYPVKQYGSPLKTAWRTQAQSRGTQAQSRGNRHNQRSSIYQKPSSGTPIGSHSPSIPKSSSQQHLTASKSSVGVHEAPPKGGKGGEEPQPPPLAAGEAATDDLDPSTRITSQQT